MLLPQQVIKGWLPQHEVHDVIVAQQCWPQDFCNLVQRVRIGSGSPRRGGFPTRPYLNQPLHVHFVLNSQSLALENALRERPVEVPEGVQVPLDLQQCRQVLSSQVRGMFKQSVDIRRQIGFKQLRYTFRQVLKLL